MTLLVADVGGTNTRIAIARMGGEMGGEMAGLARFENADYASFYEVLASYAATHDLTHVTTCSVAVAGPVTSGSAYLTNRGWTVDAAGVAGVLESLSAGSVQLVNDLAALGYALPDLTTTQLSLIRASHDPGRTNNQKLVIGMGTGFNICVVTMTRHGPVVIEAELGHASLPASASAALTDALGSEEAAQFTTYEHLLAGRGLPRLYRFFSDGQNLTGSQILAAYHPENTDAAARSVDLAARVLGLIARELVFQYLPFGGIHFAGGVARGLLATAAKDLFLTAFAAPGHLSDQVALVPVYLITDDAAGLSGAAYFARPKTP
jgi:glucokinase